MFSLIFSSLRLLYIIFVFFFFFSSRRRHTRSFHVTGVQTCALPILVVYHPQAKWPEHWEAGLPRKANPVDSEELCGGEPHRASARLLPHLALLRDSHLPGNGHVGRERTFRVAAERMRQLVASV